MLRLRFRLLRDISNSGVLGSLLSKVEDIGKPLAMQVKEDIGRRSVLERRFDDISASVLGGLYLLSICIYWTYFITVSNKI